MGGAGFSASAAAVGATSLFLPLSSLSRFSMASPALLGGVLAGVVFGARERGGGEI